MSTRKTEHSATEAKDREPTKSSFSIRAGTHPAIRRASGQFGVTQGEIVNLSPALFSLVAERSLREREGNLPRVRRLAEEASRRLDQIARIAPYMEMAVSWGQRYVDELATIEAKSIEQREVHGLSEEVLENSDFFGVTHNEGWNAFDPFLETLQEMAREVESTAISHIETDERDEQIAFRCCESNADSDLRERLGDYWAELVIDEIYTEEEAATSMAELDRTLDNLEKTLDGEERK